MRRLFWVLLAASIAAAGCEYITPAPEVEIVYVNPLTGVVNQGSGGQALAIEEIQFKVYNNVEAVITGMDIEYLDSEGRNTVSPTLPMVEMHLMLASSVDSVSVVDSIPVPISSQLVNYIYQNDDHAIARLRFYGEDAFGYDKTFDVDMDWGIWKLD